MNRLKNIETKYRLNLKGLAIININFNFYS